MRVASDSRAINFRETRESLRKGDRNYRRGHVAASGVLSAWPVFVHFTFRFIHELTSTVREAGRCSPGGRQARVADACHLSFMVPWFRRRSASGSRCVHPPRRHGRATPKICHALELEAAFWKTV